MHGVQGRGGQGQETGLCGVSAGRDGQDPGTGDHDPPGGGAEQAPGIHETRGTGDEHPLSPATSGVGTGLDDATRGFVSRNQRIAHARKRGHAAGPEESLGTRTYAGPVDLDDHVRRSWSLESHLPKRKALSMGVTFT